VDSKPGFVAESIADGTEVSWMPTLPTKSDQPFGMFLLAPRVAPTEESAPAWWGIDQRFRRAVVDGGPIEVRRTLLRQLAAAFPTHPFLTHYRVIAELGSNRFDNAWLEAQTAGCQLPSWYLVAWTHLPWTRVRRLPCVAKLSADALDNVGRYVAEWAVLAFRADRDDAQLQNLAARVIDATFLRTEFRGFNYAPSDFAWLWLKARP
jgi:hypothetical protein